MDQMYWLASFHDFFLLLESQAEETAQWMPSTTPVGMLMCLMLYYVTAKRMG